MYEVRPYLPNQRYWVALKEFTPDTGIFQPIPPVLLDKTVGELVEEPIFAPMTSASTVSITLPITASGEIFVRNVNDKSGETEG